MKIATSPFVYWGVAVFMPEKLGNLQQREIAARCGPADFALAGAGKDGHRHADRTTERELEGQTPRKAHFARGSHFSPPSALTAALPAAWRFPSRRGDQKGRARRVMGTMIAGEG